MWGQEHADSGGDSDPSGGSDGEEKKNAARTQSGRCHRLSAINVWTCGEAFNEVHL